MYINVLSLIFFTPTRTDIFINELLICTSGHSFKKRKRNILSSLYRNFETHASETLEILMNGFLCWSLYNHRMVCVVENMNFLKTQIRHVVPRKHIL